MSTEDDEFLESLRATFRVEATEHLQAIATGLLALEKTPAPEAQRDVIATVFRAAHSLKGAARAADFAAIESSCQSLEDRFAAWKSGQSKLSPGALDQAHRALDAIAAALSAPKAAEASAVPPLQPEEAPIPPPANKAVPAVPAAEQTIPASGDSVRISVAKLDARLVAAEEMLTAKLTTAERVQDLRALAQGFESRAREWAKVEADARALRQAQDRPMPGLAPDPRLARLLQFIERDRDQSKSIESKLAALTRAAQQDGHVIGKLVDEMLEDSKKLLLLPFATIAAPLPKLVRNLCRDLGKEADLVIRGEEVEIDKRILEEMKDPLTHLLRNCIDHGVETPEARLRLGKPARAGITLAVSQVDGSKVEILVSDDGAGIDAGKIKVSAIRHGLLSADDAGQMSDAEARDLIFLPEVSASPMITRLSGRGLGMAIVRENAEKLGGAVSVESEPGQGTRVRVVLPALLATFRGVLIEAAGRVFIVPTAHVERVARVKAAEIQTVEGRETIALGGRALALVRLAEVLTLPPAPAAGDPSAATPILVLGLGEQRLAFAVDAVLDEQEVLVKPLRKPLSRVRNIAGAAVLGSGRVAPILNVVDLLKFARQSGGATRRAPAVAKPAQAAAKSVLVAEDSITSRMLLKGMLESAGYQVRTAVDGMEAYTLLHAESFDLLVSDVEMPRLDGFGLTTRIRADNKLAELPVVLVTALESREDRERGIDAGANAYIVKSGLDQSSLLDTIRRLL